MTVDEAKNLLGQRFDAGLAKVIKVTRQAVNRWRKDGSMPEIFADRVTLYAAQRAAAAGQAEATQG